MAAGGAARVIGYVYGGQGTINVPSWSPDSKMVAFVSNTDAVKWVASSRPPRQRAIGNSRI
jgi:Tol biopolymer transport system component